jgi:hypothetical protein
MFLSQQRFRIFMPMGCENRALQVTGPLTLSYDTKQHRERLDLPLYHEPSDFYLLTRDVGEADLKLECLSSAYQEPPLDADRFSRDVLALLSNAEREEQLRAMEGMLNARLAGTASLGEFQDRLYVLIDDLNGRLGHSLFRWDYNCEIEYWGGMSYMDSAIPDELLLKSTYPLGVELRWGDSYFPSDVLKRPAG